jgi:hypothetical protein
MRCARAAMNRGISTDAGFKAYASLRPHGCVRLKAQEGMQSLVAENFMRVVGTHIYCAKVQKIAHFKGGSSIFSVWLLPISGVGLTHLPGGSYFLYSAAYFYHPGSGFGNWISSFVYLRQIIINHV